MESDAFAALWPLIAEAKTLNDRTNERGDWADEAERQRWHALVGEVYTGFAPLLRALAQAGMLSATYRCDEEHFVWFEVDRVDAGGTIDFSGDSVVEITDPPAHALLFDRAFEESSTEHP